MDSCRLEKAFRHFGHDITDEDHVLEAGLGFAVKTDKGAFIGRDAVLRKKEAGVERRLMQFRLSNPSAHLHHNEPLLRDGEIVGFLTSGGYGHFVDASLAQAYIPKHLAAETSGFEIEIIGDMRAARIQHEPLFDPAGERMRG